MTSFSPAWLDFSYFRAGVLSAVVKAESVGLGLHLWAVIILVSDFGRELLRFSIGGLGTAFENIMIIFLIKSFQNGFFQVMFNLFMKLCWWWRKVLESSGPLPSRLLSSSTEYHNRTWHKPTWPPNDSHCCILILLPVSLSTWGYKQQHNNILRCLYFNNYLCLYYFNNYLCLYINY